MKLWFVYILKSLRNGKFYKGITDSIERRLKEHGVGQVQTTAYMRPLTLIHVEVCNSRAEARRLEIFFKSGYGRETIKELDADS